MKVIYARETIEPSIFLAGPTPRSKDVPSWRPRALELLEGFKGTVYVPEDRSGNVQFEYYDQINWEWHALETSSVILFWIPREIETMPALTTNVEFGMYAASGKIVVGRPPEAQKMKYLDALASRYSIDVYDNLEMTVKQSILRARGK
jgi:hypothetical protein